MFNKMRRRKFWKRHRDMRKTLLKCATEEVALPVGEPPSDIGEIEIKGKMERVDIHYEFPVIHKEDNEIVETFEVESDAAANVRTKPGKKLSKKGTKQVETAKARKHEEPKLNLPEPVFRIIEDHYTGREPAPPLPNNYIRYIEKTPEELYEMVEYDLDETDMAWLEIMNEKRGKEGVQPISEDVFELVIDRLEKESYFQMQISGIEQGPTIDDDAVCCICMDGECQNANAILFCDMCNLAVHQECYGVPYIPEGQWLCRRCFLSPSIAVDCVLCPNKGGAFKQTECKRWAHVVCAIWIPEVCFANTVFLEPIDNINKIPNARWKLCCFICKQKGVGACIQCYKPNCYTAFHVTCAQQVGLCMRMETVKLASGLTVKKIAYCDPHAPPDFLVERDNGSPTGREKLKETRKKLAEKRSAPPVVSWPTISPEQVAKISNSITIQKKSQFMREIKAYWKLKRIHRNGVPLLRRLQIASNTSNFVNKSSRKYDPNMGETSLKDYAEITRVRQDLEKSRLLCELTRKREKLKREVINATCKEWDMRIQPFNYFLASIVDEIICKDTQSIFTQPVDPEHVPDYLSVVKTPMDLSTMRNKIFEFHYDTIEDLKQDFQLMIDNCLLYNSPDTVFYRIALRMQEFGGVVFREAKRRYDAIGFTAGGTMTKQPPPEYHADPKAIDETKLAAEIEFVIEDNSRQLLPFEEHVTLLEETLDKCLNISHPLSRKKKYMKIKGEIVRLKRRKRQLDNRDPATMSAGDISSVDEMDILTPSAAEGAISSDSGDNEDDESSAKSLNKSRHSTLRRRLRSTENSESQSQFKHREQSTPKSSRVLRRLSKSSETVSVEKSNNITSVNATNSSIGKQLPAIYTPVSADDLAMPQPPRRGRPPKTFSVGRKRGRIGRTSFSVRVATVRQQQQRQQLRLSRQSGTRGRPRGRRAAKPLRRSVRVVHQQMTAQMHQNSNSGPENDAERLQEKCGSRQGSPISRNLSPRGSRNLSPTQQTPTRSIQPVGPVNSYKKSSTSPHQRKSPARQQSPILGSPLKPHQMYMLKKPKIGNTTTVAKPAVQINTDPMPKVRGRPARNVLHINKSKLAVLSPKTMEATAKSVVCEDKESTKSKMAAVKVKSGRLRKLVHAEGDSGQVDGSGKQLPRGGASRGKSNSDLNIREKKSKITVNQNRVTNRVLPQRKVRGPASAVGKRNKQVVLGSNDPFHAYGSTIDEKKNKSSDSIIQSIKGNLPLTIPNGLDGAVSKQNSSPSKRRNKRGANISPVHGSNINSEIGSTSTTSFFNSTIGGSPRKLDSFSVYRSGGDYDINSCSEGDSGNDEEEEDDEMEEEEEEDDEEGEVDEDDDSDGEPSGQKGSEEEDDDGRGEEGDGDTSDSHNSSSDSDSSGSSSSSITSSSTGSTVSKASSSSSITTPRHFHNAKRQRRRSSHNTHGPLGFSHVAHGGERATATNSLVNRPNRHVVTSSAVSPSSNNNNNILCSNKEREKDFNNPDSSRERINNASSNKQCSGGGGAETADHIDSTEEDDDDVTAPQTVFQEQIPVKKFHKS